MKNLRGFYLTLKTSATQSSIKKLIFYFFIIISLVSTMQNVNIRYGAISSQIFINKALPGFKGEMDDKLFLKNYFYDCTSIMIDQPLTLLTHAMPYLKYNNTLTGMASYDIPGYFDADSQNETFIYFEEEGYEPQLPSIKEVSLSRENYKDPYYVLKYFISGDAQLEIDTEFLKQWDFYSLMNQRLRISGPLEEPKILIFHTHAREKYKDGTTVVDVGKKLKKVFEEDYGLSTMHVVKEYYADASEDVKWSYQLMEPSIQKILDDHPSIEIVLDLHRDGVKNNVHLMTNVDNKDTAKLMFVNGLCMNRDFNGNIVQKQQLINPYINENLAFSMQAQEIAYKYYPNLMRKVYLKEYRYSLHMRPLSLLVEIGAQTNTGQEAFNAVGPLANIIAKVIEKD